MSEHTYTTSGLHVGVKIKVVDPVVLGRHLAGKGFSQQLDFLYGLADEMRANNSTVHEMLSSFRKAMDFHSEEVLAEILAYIMDLHRQIEIELAQRHNSGRLESHA